MRRNQARHSTLLIVGCSISLFVLNAQCGAVEPGPGFTHVGKIKPRHAREIKSSNWSVGAETMDRDYTIYSLFGYRSTKDGQLVTVWRSSERPGVRPEFEMLTLTIEKGSFDDPVWVDLVCGNVYDIDESLWKSEGDRCTLERCRSTTRWWCSRNEQRSVNCCQVTDRDAGCESRDGRLGERGLRQSVSEDKAGTRRLQEKRIPARQRL